MSDSDDAIASYSVKGLNRLIKALHQRPPVCRVGILGSETRKRKPGDKTATPTNAEVGAAHEFGTTTHPKRSFLRSPISGGLQKEMDRAQLFDKQTLKEVIERGTIVPWMEKVAICAEACVQDAFNTGGNGDWPAWKTPNYSNNAGQLLVDTKQLRESILSDVDGSLQKRSG